MSEEKSTATRQPDPTENTHTKKCTGQQVNPWLYTAVLTFNCLVGLGLSLYAYSVELKLENDKNYKPYCDVGPHVSCTKAFGSKYGKGMGIFGKEWESLHQPNSLFGIMFYSMLGTLVQSNTKLSVNISMFLIIMSNFASLYFSYILYFILQDACLVCIMIYIVNVANLMCFRIKWNILKNNCPGSCEQIDKADKTNNDKKTR